MNQNEEAICVLLADDAPRHGATQVAGLCFLGFVLATQSERFVEGLGLGPWERTVLLLGTLLALAIVIGRYAGMLLRSALEPARDRKLEWCEGAVHDVSATWPQDLQTVVGLGVALLYRVRVTADSIDVLSVYGNPNVFPVGGAGEASDAARLAAVLRLPESGGPLRRIAARAGDSRGAFEVPMPVPGGPNRWLRNDVRVAGRPPGAVEIVGYLVDVTRERDEQRHLQQFTTLLTLGQMATGMAHELNQPLSSISFAAQNAQFLMERQALDRPALGAKLQKIGNEARRAAKLVEHMRVFAPNEREPRQPIVWQEVIAHTLEIAATGMRGLVVRQNLPADLPAVMGDAIGMERILVQLISNSVDAYESTMAASVPVARVLELGGCAADGWVVLRLADRAGGIEPALLGRVFEPFFTTKPPGKGTGLGLALCFGAVVEMGGTITARNEHGGAVFEIRLPAAVHDNAAA